MRNNRKIQFYILCLFLFAILPLHSQSINLSGKWTMKLDPQDVGVEQKWHSMPLNEEVFLPGSLDTSDKGYEVDLTTEWTGRIVDKSWFDSPKYKEYRKEGNIKIPFWLQPKKKYTGAAWYNRTFEIDEKDSSKQLILNLERPHWETTVWIDGEKIDTQNSLATAHSFILPSLAKGTHTISIRVDNRIKEFNVGNNAHSISDHTQTNWNGIAGDISIKPHTSTYIKNIKVYPDVNTKQAKLLIQLSSPLQDSEAKIQIKAESQFTPKKHLIEAEEVLKLSKGDSEQVVYLPMGEDFYQWDEYTPYSYKLDATLVTEKGNDKFETQFGMIKLDREGTQLKINDKAIFLRGTLDCAVFPLTGFPPTTTDEWKRIFNIIKGHGLNHVRFHSWCPPKAAFLAADELGIYLQAEGSSWGNFGDGEGLDTWIYQESEKILDLYGNHPSFILYTQGNEPDGKNQGRFLGDLVTHLKEYDNRRFYTSGAGWPAIPENEFNNDMQPRLYVWGQGLDSFFNKYKPSTNYDWGKIIQKYDIPYISHEVGQWCVYPNFKEIDKYKGVVEAKNFEIFRETLEQNNMMHLADSFLIASGIHQALAYKDDIEAALRTKGFAGFQLLGLNDFPGQGTALVGVLDAFWEEKGYIKPEEFKQFSGNTVPLVRLPKMTYLNNENLKCDVEVTHYGESDLKGVYPTWSIADKDGQILYSENLEKQNIKRGTAIKIGAIDYSLSKIEHPQMLILSVNVDNNINSWKVWVYPTDKHSVNQKIKQIDKLDSQTVNFIKKGGVALFAPKKGSLVDDAGGNIVMGFSPIFWNTAWTNKQAPHVLGLLMNPEHKAFEFFPTQFHTNYQWWPLVMNSNALKLNKLNLKATPIVRIIDDWFSNEPLALIVEAKIGKGKILISMADILNNKDGHIEVEQLKYSLLQYMDSDQFNPTDAIDAKELMKLFKK